MGSLLVSSHLAFGQFEGLVINEILPNPRNAAGIYLDSNQDGITNVFDDEFIELLNNSSSSIDLAGYWISESNTNIRRHVFSSHILPPGGSIVVFGGGSLLNFSNPPAQIATGGGLSLNNNDPETVYLFSSQSTRVDQVSCLLTASHDAISTVRNPDGTGAFTNHYLAAANARRASPGYRVDGTPFLRRQPPLLLDLPNQTAFVGRELLFDVRAYDPADRDEITLSVTNQPDHSSFSTTGGMGLFRFTPTSDQAGQLWNVTFLASDPDGTHSRTLSIRIINPNSTENLWINEIHYDNASDDSDEGIEIAGEAGSILSDYSLILYNGPSGHFYASNALTGTLDHQQCGFGTAWFGYAPNGIQNGPNDGIALVKGPQVVQFLSYDGVMTASNGPAAGMTSVDIGVKESATTPVGHSLQLKGTGTVYSAFTWTTAQPHSHGTLNLGQAVECLSPPSINIQKTVYLGHDDGASAPGVESILGARGAAVTYAFTVSNTGSSTITNAEIQDVSLSIPPIVLGTLVGGEVRTAYVNAVISGDLRNTATVSGQGPDGILVTDDDTAEVVEFIPSIDIQLTVYRGQDGGAACPGSDSLQATNHTPATFCLVVENNGTTNLNSLAIHAPSLGIPPILIGTLASGGFFATSVASVVTSTLTHVATVEGIDPNGDPVRDQDSAHVEIIRPALQLQKTVYLGHDNGTSFPGTHRVAGTNGSPITFCFQVANTGDSPLHDLWLYDPGLSGFTSTSLGTLAPGESTSLFFESVLRSSHVNSATATATTVTGDAMKDSDSATVQLTAQGNIYPGGEYTLFDLGTLGGDSSAALGVNDLGQVVGWARDADGKTNAFLWQNGSMESLGFLPGGSNSTATAINNKGEITGHSTLSNGYYHAFLFVSNSLTDLGTLGGRQSWARRINEQTEITGSSQLLSNNPTSSDPESFLWRSNQFTHIPPFHNYYSCDGNGINEEGFVCGITFLWATNDRWWAYVFHDDNGNGLCDSGEMKLLGTLGVQYSFGSYSGANAINDLGQVVGWTCLTNTPNPQHAFWITPTNGQWKIPAGSPNPTNSLMKDLGALESPSRNSTANDINNQAWIVGNSSFSTGTNQAVLWRDGSIENLNDLIVAHTGWTLTDATAINEQNEIVGSGLVQGQQRAFLLRKGGRITQAIHQVEEPTLQWDGVWSPNDTTFFTVEYCDSLETPHWLPVEPASQWPTTNTTWTPSNSIPAPVRFFRIRAE